MRRSSFQQVALTTLIVLFGLQIFRVLPVPLVWFFGQRLAYSPQQVGLMLLPLPLFVALTPLIQRGLGVRRSALLSAFTLAAVRIAIQWIAVPVWDLALAAGGLFCFSIWLLSWLPLAAPHAQEPNANALMVAWPAAVLIDTASRALLLDYDLAWRTEWWAFAVVIGLAVLIVLLAWTDTRRYAPDAHIHPVRPAMWLGMGAWLFLAFTLTQNAPVLMTVTGWGDVAAHWAVITLSALGALLVILTTRVLLRWQARLGVGVVFTVVVALLATDSSVTWLWVVPATLGTWAALGLLLSHAAMVIPAEQHAMRWRNAAALSAMWIIFIGLLLLDFYPPWGTIAAAVLLAAIVVWIGRRSTQRRYQRAGLLACALIVAPVWLIVTAWVLLDQPPQHVAPARGNSLRVMTYNIHHGTDAVSRMDLEAIADAIAAEDPDVVALNEASRGYISTGYVDTIWLISQRLGMPYVVGMSNSGGRFGNVVLSRYPITQWDNTYYRNLGPEVRGVLRARVDSPIGEVTFYATHLDHRSRHVALRDKQVQELLTLWAGQPHAVILGDLNARPDEPEMAALYERDLIDVLRVTGQDNAYTHWNAQPLAGYRIDYIFITPDLTVTRTWVPQTRASDHLPVMAEIILREGD